MKVSFVALFAVLATSAVTASLTLTNEEINDGKVRTPKQLQAIQDDGDVNRKCHESNGGDLPLLKPGNYQASKFHGCFRTTSQIYEYLDVLVQQNAKIFTKFQIAESVRKQPIYGYKLSPKEQTHSLYFESLIHAREWTTGASTLWAFSRYLDDIANGNPGPTDLYNLYYVPVVNVDGYDISWTPGKRYQRKNANQVDLNRNFISKFVNPKPPKPVDQNYPGPFPFSEPEAKGIDIFGKSKQGEILGFVDVHSYAGLIMYPYGDTHDPIGGGEDEKFAVLGNAMAVVMNNVTGKTLYVAEPSGKLYLAYGAFDDYHYRTYGKPTLTIEMTAKDFVVPFSEIPQRGDEIYYGLWQFAKQVAVFNGTAPTTVTPTTVTPTTAIPTTAIPTTTPALTTAPTPTTTKPQC
ncbi:hypothetical protein DYB36_008169 [Aphanomyces astaci]|uniref:Peptidase M14 domain-containing protein n=1 Tax=Aphanomyces astaci TaxID=112090 RepID=A0A397AVE0_APHAT|nr:hypothetical protein DYB36_008169 [Aphanomyces astaci]